MKVQELATTANARARRLKAVEAVAVMGMTHAEAAAYSGMKVTSLSVMMSKPEVKRYIADMQEAQAKRLNISREEVIQGILDEIKHARMVNEPGTALRGWETIAKMQGYNAPVRVSHELPEEATKFMEAMQTMRDEDLFELTGKQGLIELTSDDYHEVAGE